MISRMTGDDVMMVRLSKPLLGHNGCNRICRSTQGLGRPGGLHLPEGL